MRLTLRTMLACLDADDRLDPADVEDLSQKIQQSKYASDLASKIRRLVQHPRVGTLRLDAKGNGLDANSVAEYLDNTLASDKIADFERNCIESDVRLAEVAACHQILVLVLEQPAEIEPAVRERMYQLGKESKREVSEDAPISETRLVAGGGSVRIDQPTAPPVTPAPPKTHEVPDYLRAGRRPSLWPLALAAVLAFIAVGIGLRLMGPLDRTHPMAQLLGTDDPAEREATPTDPTIPTPDTESVVPPALPAGDGSSEKKKIPDDAYGDEPVIENNVPMPEEPPVPTDDDLPPVDRTPTDRPRPMPVEPAPSDVAPVDPPEPQPVQPQPAQPPPADVGRLASEDQVLVRLNQEGQYERVPARASIFAGDRLVVFPAYRPQVLLANNVQLTVAGDSRLQMGMTDAAGIANVSMEFGHLLAASVGKADAKLALHLPNVVGVATFDTVDSELAIEVRNFLPPGANPQAPGSTIPVVRLYATRGSITWQEGPPDAEAKGMTIESGHVRNYVGQEPGETVALVALPDWIDGKNIADIDRRAAREVEAKLTADRPLELALQEMASTSERRAEVRSLAIRSLAYLDQFEPLVTALGDESQGAYWRGQISVLRDAIARNPETATFVHDTFVKLRGAEDAANLYRMLWGFSPEDLQAGLAEELVKSLDVEQLDYRVLAFENLYAITGTTQLYRPQNSPQRRRTPVAEWRKLLKDGEIVYKTLPAPINDPKPAANPLRASESPLEP